MRPEKIKKQSRKNFTIYFENNTAAVIECPPYKAMGEALDIASRRNTKVLRIV